MKASSRILLVVAGYVAAALVASAVVGIYVAATDSPDRQASGGMYAFGDAFLFLAVFALSAIPATGAAMFFLRPYRLFWRAASLAAVGVALTAIAAQVAYLWFRDADASSLLGTLAMLSPLRILFAPLCGITFLVAAFFAPGRSFRAAFLVAAASELIVFAWVGVMWFIPS